MNSRIHFHTLDALRFFAFFKVFLLHIPLEGNMPVFALLKSGGGIGVSFFFVLSGFLITYILSYEKLHVGQISIKKFFMRRSLRIWPLFLLVVAIVAIIPDEIKTSLGLHMIGNGYAFDWRYSFTFTENYKMILEDNHPRTTPLIVFWSLCVEEHFYILWMLLFYLLPVKRIPVFLLISIPLAIISRYIEPSITHNARIFGDDILTNLDYFAIGGLPAYFVAKNYKRVAELINNIPLLLKRLYLLIAILVVIFQNYTVPLTDSPLFNIFRPTIFALLFIGIIGIFIPVDSKIKIGEKSIFTRLGKISYGLYVYHLIFIHLALKYCIDRDIKMDNLINISIFMAVIFTTSVVTSSISYKYFEKKFIMLRERVNT